jgi:hypothetical protein
MSDGLIEVCDYKDPNGETPNGSGRERLSTSQRWAFLRSQEGRNKCRLLKLTKPGGTGLSGEPGSNRDIAWRTVCLAELEIEQVDVDPGPLGRGSRRHREAPCQLASERQYAATP